LAFSYATHKDHTSTVQVYLRTTSEVKRLNSAPTLDNDLIVAWSSQ